MKLRTGLPLAVFLVFVSFLMGLTKSYVLPKLKPTLATIINKEAQSFFDLNIQAKNIEVNFLRLSVSLKNLNTKPKGELSKTLGPLSIKKISLYPSLFALLKGELRVKNILISDSEIFLVIKEIKSSGKPAIENFDFLKTFPLNKLDKVEFKNLNLYSKIHPYKLSLHSGSTQGFIENLGDGILAKIRTDNFSIKNSEQKERMAFNLDTKVLLENESIYLKNLDLFHSDRTSLNLQGEIDGPWLKNEFNKIKTSASGRIALEEVYRLALHFVPGQKVPELKGQVDFDFSYTQDQDQLINPSLTVKGQGLKVDRFPLGDLEIQSTTSKKKVNLKKAIFSSPVGDLDLSGAEIKLNKNKSIIASPIITNFSLHKLLRILSRKKPRKIKTELAGDFNANCKGQLQPSLSFACNAKTKSASFSLFSLKKNENKILIQGIGAEADLDIDSKKITYSGAIKMKDTNVNTTGFVEFDEGFEANYDGYIGQIKENIKELYSLDLDGKIIGNGKVFGNSKTAQFHIDSECKECSLKDWNLGDLKANFQYKKGNLYFKNIVGKVGKSDYQGTVTVDVINEKIETEALLPKVFLEDLQFVVSDNIEIPIDFQGPGSAKIKLWGPLKLDDLNFDLKSKFSYGKIDRQPFDEVKSDLVCNSGNITSKTTYIKKGASSVNVYGGMNDRGILNVKLSSNVLNLIELEHLSKYTPFLLQNFKADGTLKGPIKSPVLNIDGRFLNRFKVKDLLNNKLNLQISREKITGKLDYGKEDLYGSFIYPFKKGDVYLKIKANQWKFHPLLKSQFTHLKNSNLDSKISGNLDLMIPNNNLKLSQGVLKLSDFYFFKNNNNFYLKDPIESQVQNGILSDFSSSFSGNNTNITVTSKGSRLNNLNLQTKGQLDLGLVFILSKYVEEFTGNTSLSLSLKGPLNNPLLQGSIYTQDSSLKVVNFDQAFRAINAEATINNNRLVLNSAESQIGGGTIYGDGSINFDVGRIELDLNSNISKISLEPQEGVDLTVDGQIKITGKDFPYLLSGNLNIPEGQIKKTLLLDQKSKVKKTLSKFAPQSDESENENTINLDVNVDMSRQIPVDIVTSQFELNTSIVGAIKVKNNLKDPQLNGEIQLTEDSLLLLRQKKFEINSGTLVYENSSPKNPNIIFDANGRIENYDINISVIGTGQDPKVSFLSQPQLDRNEILNLIILGYTSADTEEGGTTNEQTDQLTFEVSSAILKEKLGLTKGVQNRLGLEFDISSSYNEDQGTPIPTLTIKKRIGNKLDASASRTIENAATNKVKAEYKLNKNISVIGSFIKEERQETNDEDENSNETLGLDLEYKVEFK